MYGAAPTAERRAVHAALAGATDPETDPDRRAWHRAHAVTAPDEEVAAELIECAGRAERRGGIAAAAALLERAVTFTSEPCDRVMRARSRPRARNSKLQTFRPPSLCSPSPRRARSMTLARHRCSTCAPRSRSTSDAVVTHRRCCSSAARRLEPLDAEFARETYLEALLASIYAGELSSGPDPAGVGRAARSAPLGPEPLSARELLLIGLATRLTEGYAAAAPGLTEALRAYRAEESRLDGLCVAFNIAAMELWDDEAWLELASTQAALARATGTLILLPYALDYLAGFYVQAGDLVEAERLVTDAAELGHGIRADTLPYIPLRLAAWRGQASVALELVDRMTRGARERGEGCALAAADYAAAILHNGLGQYELAVDAAENAAASDEMTTSSWALYELVEAASRSGQHEVARDAVDRLSARTRASGTVWAAGTEARSRALIESGDNVDELHRQAIESLGQTRMVAHLARARLTYGEWLRREGRRVDAREQLRAAHESFISMGADGFADRAQRELLATGEKVRKRRDNTRDDLTPQELKDRAARSTRTYESGDRHRAVP